MPFSKIIKTRYFWFHLVLSDLRLKYRRSFLGIGWAMLHPLCMTLLLSFVMSRILHTPFFRYATFIFSGLILWDFISTSAQAGCFAFLNADGYIRQFAHPLIIYTLRSTLTCFLNFCLAFLGLTAWMVLFQPIGLSWISLPFSFLLLFLFGWPIATLTALINVRFRDFSQMCALLLQALWYVSPIFLMPELFQNVGLSWVIEYNPIYHLSCLFRAPLLENQFPHLWNFAYVSITLMFLWLSAYSLLKASEKRVIFYL